MALPQRRDPYDDRPELREVERRRYEAGGGGWFLGWWWIWMLIFIGLFWFAGWGWGGYGGWWWGPGRGAAYGAPNVNQVNARAVSGDGAAILDATDKMDYLGKTFQVRNAHVQDIVNDHVLWLTGNGSAPMLAVLTGKGNSLANAKVGKGDRVDVIGQVEKAPPASAAQENWKLDKDQTDQLEQQGAYVAATQVQKLTGNR